MLTTIRRYALPIDHRVSLAMPRNAVILSVTKDESGPTVWAHVDPSEIAVRRWFRVIGTGHPIHAPPGHYVGSFQTDMSLFFHVFDDGEGGIVVPTVRPLE